MIRFGQKFLIIVLVLILLTFIGIEVRERISNKYDSRQDVISGLELKTYEQNDLSFSYPDKYIVERGSGLGGGYITPATVRISMPANSFKNDKTNFAGASFVVGRSDKKELVSSCLEFSDISMDEEMRNIGTRKVGQVTFRSLSLLEAAAGNLYQSRLYRTIHGGKCYELALTVHTGNIFNYPEGTVTEFNKENAFLPFEKMVDTFKFLN